MFYFLFSTSAKNGNMYNCHHVQCLCTYIFYKAMRYGDKMQIFSQSSGEQKSQENEGANKNTY